MIRLDPRGRHLLAYDLLVVAVSIVLAIALRFEAIDVVGQILVYAPAILVPLVVRPVVNVWFGLYRREWRFASIHEMVVIVAAVATGSLASFIVVVLLAAIDAPGTAGFPRSFFVLEGMTSLILIGGGRFGLRMIMEAGASGGGAGVTTLVYGAGETGATIARLASHADSDMAVVGFLDDDPRKRHSTLAGRRIIGGLDALDGAVRATGARRLVVAIPGAPGSKVREIYARARALGLDVRTVAHPRRLLDGTAGRTALRPVSLDDLLRRPAVTLDTASVRRYISGARVVVTGAGGSIGGELARQIAALAPAELTLLDHSEVALWSVEQDLLNIDAPSQVQLRMSLTDIRSAAGVDAAFAAARPQVVFHAAALKHVPIVELYPSEGVLTNVVGTANVLAACERHRVERFVLISTDKAVEPTSVLGATKRLAEQLTLDAASRLDRPYAVVRFGNVLGSSGSVVPAFQRRLEQGLPLVITDPEVTRYFMTIEESVSLILEAGAAARRGDVLVLDMGEPVRIVDLARDLLALSGLDPDKLRVVYSGLRPGERRHEILTAHDESVEPTENPGVLRAVPAAPGRETVSATLVSRLQALAETRADEEVLAVLREAVIAPSTTEPDAGAPSEQRTSSEAAP